MSVFVLALRVTDAFRAVSTLSATTTSLHEKGCRCVCCLHGWLHGGVLFPEVKEIVASQPDT